MGYLIRLVLIIAGAYAIYQNRYRILNSILGINSIRRFVVAFGMDIPFVRDRFLQTVFRG